MTARTIILAAALSGVPGLLHAQFDFKLDGRNVQVHSFASQGFMYSNQNNYMAMPTSKGADFFLHFENNLCALSLHSVNSVWPKIAALRSVAATRSSL